MQYFISHNERYNILPNGVIEQANPQPYKYDSNYVATYDTEAYKRGNETLQAMRFGFATAAHGKPIQSLLDVGCANGAFCLFAQQSVKDVKGFDVTGEPVPGVDVVSELVPADVYTFHDVLEHIKDCSFLNDLQCETISISLPCCHFMELLQLQKYDGVGDPAEIKSGSALDWFNNDYKHRKPNEHIRHFTPHSLANFMYEYGWRDIATSYHEDIIRKSTHGLSNIISMAFKRIN